MEKEDVIKKIKKCLALAKSENPTEAATAMRQAQKLMELYQINDLDVSLADVSEAAARAYTVNIVNWESQLAGMIADAFGCHRHSQHAYGLKNGKVARTHSYIFVGVGAAPTVAQYAYEVLSRQCGVARKAHISKQPKNCKPATKTARGDLFAQGWVCGVQRLVERFSGTAKDDELIEQYLKINYPALTTVKPKDRTAGKNTKINDFYHGKSEAGNARLDRGVDGFKRELLT